MIWTIAAGVIKPILAAWLILAVSASAAPAAHLFLMLGSGKASCGYFTQSMDAERAARARNARSAEIDPELTAYTRDYMVFLFFTNGFLSGVNFASASIGALGENTDSWSRMTWLENYCRQHPFDEFGLAVIAMVNYLTPQAAGAASRP